MKVVCKSAGLVGRSAFQEKERGLGRALEVAHQSSPEHVVRMVVKQPEAIKLRGVTCHGEGESHCEGSSIIVLDYIVIRSL